MIGYFLRKREHILAFLLFFSISCLLTWPLLAHITNSAYGGVGDPVGSIFALKWFKESALLRHGDLWHFTNAAYPVGIKATLPLPIFLLPVTLLTLLPHGEVLLYNIMILLGLTLNGYIMFLLGYKLFKSRFASLGMGLLFIFCPYALTQARYHVLLAQIYVFPLLLYALLNLRKEFTTRNKILLFLALLLAFNINPYYSYMSVLVLAVLAFRYAIRKLRKGFSAIKPDFSFIRTCILLALLALIITLPLTFINYAFNTNKISALNRQEGDLYTYAAHPWNYYVPSPDSAFFGDAAQAFAKGRVLSTNVEEYVLFLGYANMALALIALALWLFRHRSKMAAQITENLDQKRDCVLSFAVLLGAAAFLFSLPPTIKLGSANIHLPSWFMYKVIPSIRVYSRFGVLVFFAVTISSGAGISFLEQSLRSRRKLVSSLIIVLVLALMLSEFVEIGSNPTQALYDQNSSTLVQALVPEDAVIAEYPFVASDEAYNYRFLWDQFFLEGKSMLNGYALGTEGESLRNCVLNLLDPRTPALLAYMGAEYVIVHDDLYAKGSEYTYVKQKIDLSSPPAGLKVVGDTGGTTVLKVEARRPEAVVLYDPRFSTVIMPEFGNGWWLGAEKKWAMKIDAEQDIRVNIEFSILSIRGERMLHIDLGDGRNEVFSIGEDCQRISIPGVQLKRGINRIYLSTEEEPVPYKEVFGGYDSKGVCFAMSFWNLK